MRRRAIAGLLAAGALLAGGFFDGHRARGAEAFPVYGAPPELAGQTFPEPRVFMETQDWWVQGQTALAAPAPSFPFESEHVHLGIPFPLGEQFLLPPVGSGLSFPYLAQYHENVGAKVRSVRGGGANFNGTCSESGIPTDPNWKGATITQVDVRHAGAIPYSATKVGCWRDEAGTREYRFTADTTSKQGKRQYQSGAWLTQINAPAASVAPTARGWYEGPGYTNVTLKTKVRASSLAAGTVLQPGTIIAYSLAQGAKWFSAYIDADIHHGSKGTVAVESRAGTDGSFTMPALPPGDHVLLMVGWEKAAAGWNAGVLRLPFHVN